MNSEIQLQTANLFQLSDKKGKTNWNVRENKTNEVLHVLPKTISDKDAFEVLHFARKFELEAFNRGIAFGKKIKNSPLEDKITFLEHRCSELMQYNDKLANKLDELLTTGEEI